MEEMKELRSKKTELLRDLGSRFDYSGNNDRPDPEMIEEYNEIADDIDRTSKRRCDTAFSKLPAELLIEVLWHATAPELRVYIIDRVLELMLVCTDWEHLIMTTPKLWMCIELAKDMEDAEAKLALSLYLSRELPLSIFYDYNFDANQH
ncbi:SubName: Full=Uncharacterized protein {ECO:0000313/EMBL:CCA71578.1} [Serendipita indica DSM 11827]|nr:SubName: Full=Uncharacterized protein {ECO:0000313/EMBL:CCA71578.1} [Serendipita indica DSM 11827]